MKLALGIILGLVAATHAKAADVAGFSDAHLRSETRTAVAPVATPVATQNGTYAQAIDHFGGLPNQTFGQRYWYDSEFATGPDAPVLYHMCGESDVDGAYFLTDNVLAWAKTLGARVVWLEHRYYGQSQPFSDLSNDHIQYLTFDNVMEDLAGFQKWLAASQGWTGKWIALGGSYSATMAAVYRQTHPELVVGALAASAPMISGIGQAIGTQTDADGLSDTSTSSSDRSWAYQACTKFGFWQAEGGERGAQLDLPSTWLCQQVFGSTLKVYDSNAYNAAYDAPFITNGGKPANILFTYGSEDVWTDIGIAIQQDQNPNITVQMIDGAGHHFDLNAPTSSDSQAVQDARTLFTTLAQKWLTE